MNELLSPSARTWAEIDMAALKHNYEIARATGKKVMCVIKADAYGHGAVRCGRYLEKCGADAFAVACLSEALELRQGGITKTILILGYTSHEYAKVLADNDITQTLVDESHALELNEAAKAANVTVKGHIKLDTGMSRAGLFAQGHDAAMKAAASESFGYTEEPLVSSDIIGITYGSLFDATQTMVAKIDDDTYQVQVVSWYDNENSYTSQMVRTIKYFAEL